MNGQNLNRAFVNDGNTTRLNVSKRANAANTSMLSTGAEIDYVEPIEMVENVQFINNANLDMQGGTRTSKKTKRSKSKRTKRAKKSKRTKRT